MPNNNNNNNNYGQSAAYGADEHLAVLGAAAQGIGQGAYALGRGAKAAANVALPVLGQGALAVGRFGRNIAGPALGRGALAVGRFGRNVAAPALGMGALALGRGARNLTVKAARNYVGPAVGYVMRCLGNACSRVALRARAEANVQRQRIGARLGWYKALDAGFAITPADKAKVQGMIEARGPQEISDYIEQLAGDLGIRVEQHIVDDETNPTVAAYKILARQTFSADIKALHMLYFASMGNLREVDPVNEATAAHILMQVNFLKPGDISYDTVEDNDLAGLLTGYEDGPVEGERPSNNVHEGGARSRRKKTKKTRKHRKTQRR